VLVSGYSIHEFVNKIGFKFFATWSGVAFVCDCGLCILVRRAGYQRICQDRTRGGRNGGICLAVLCAELGAVVKPAEERRAEAEDVEISTSEEKTPQK
jgi:hypothetical protein